MSDRLPLCAVLSQALVAFTIEFDNEAEGRMPHSTNDHGATPRALHAPWAVNLLSLKFLSILKPYLCCR
jgi:hypothetical protein